MSTGDENHRTGTFMRQMRGENTGPKYRSPHVCGYSVRDKLETEAGFMLHVARDKGSRARWKSEAPSRNHTRDDTRPRTNRVNDREHRDTRGHLARKCQ